MIADDLWGTPGLFEKELLDIAKALNCTLGGILLATGKGCLTGYPRIVNKKMPS